MKMKKTTANILLLTAALIAAAFLLGSCAKKHNLATDFSNNPDMEYGLQWALITDVFVTFYAEPDIFSMHLGNDRRGDIKLVRGVTSVNKDGEITLWYNFDEGWLPESVLSIYQNKLQAQTVAASFAE
ncbi:MAG: hypothetical protein Ta2A_16540 [Treponemataceae bacterium]|nr:MAG: hypothetical protein Ta2A_16540 [Treponemataceae bacterium]